MSYKAEFDRVIQKIEEVGYLYAEAKSQSWQAQELKGSVLAGIIKRHPGLPANKAEIEAKATDEYQDYVKSVAKAIRQELRLKAEYEKWKSAFEALRSLNSLEKVAAKEFE